LLVDKLLYEPYHVYQYALWFARSDKLHKLDSTLLVHFGSQNNDNQVPLVNPLSILFLTLLSYKALNSVEINLTGTLYQMVVAFTTAV